MCLMILKPAGANISDNELLLGFKANSDGAGLAYSDLERVHIDKGYFNPDEFVEVFRNTQKAINNRTMLVHFRRASHGVVNKENCHPFALTHKLVAAHNGIMPLKFQNMAKADPSKTDTQYFLNENISPNIAMHSESIVFDDTFKECTEKLIGKFNKLCFIRDTDEFVIYNEKSGYWQNDCWFSNKSAHMQGFNSDPRLLFKSCMTE